MRRTNWMMGILAAALTLGPCLFGTSAWADGANDDGSDNQAACIQGCQDDADECGKICHQQGGEAGAKCAEICKNEQKSCTKECKEPANDGQ